MSALQEKDPNTAPTAQPGIDDHPNTSNPPSPPPKQPPKPRKSDTHNIPKTADLGTIHLSGEESESVPIFDTCDDIRRKIAEALKSTTKAAFARELHELLPTTKLDSRNLDRFLKTKGPRAGGHNPVFYAGYVYFEKIRVKEGKKKTKKREHMEELWGEWEGYEKDEEGVYGVSKQWKHGMPRENGNTKGVFVMAGEKPRIDQYGSLQIRGAPSVRSRGIFRKKVK